MASSQLTAKMMLPKDGKAAWTEIMQNPPTLPQGVTDGQFIVASYAKFPDGIYVFGGVAVGPKEQDFNYALFMVFDQNYHQIGGWPIDTSDWEDFYVNSIEFTINGKDEPEYILNIVEER